MPPSPAPLSPPRIAFIGGGNMAAALIGGLLARGTPASSLSVVDPSTTQRDAITARFGIATHATAAAGALQVDVIVLAVKPQQMREAVAALASSIGTQLVMSVAAGVRAVDLSRWLGGYGRIVRTMPNTPALIGLGATGMAMLPGGAEADRTLAASIMEAVGITVWVDDEDQLDAVTALSGSGPAYVFRFLESMIDGGVRLGLGREQAHRLAIQTFVGASQLAARSEDPVSVLRERVTSKAGTTAAALAVLNERNVPQAISDAMAAADRRSDELGREFGA